MYIIEKEDDLIKARTHKYVKRVKGPDGKWIYYYKDSSHALSKKGEHADEENAQRKGRIDHIRRLAIKGLKSGISRSELKDFISRHWYGEGKPSSREVSDSLSNLGHRARRAGHTAGTPEHAAAMIESGVGHDYNDDHLREAIHSGAMGVVESGGSRGPDEYNELVQRIHDAKIANSGSKKKRKKTSKKVGKTTKKVTKKVTKKKTAKKTTKKTTSSVADQARMQSKQQALLDQLKNEYGIDLNAPAESGTDVRSPEPAPEPAPAPAPAPAPEPEVAELAEVEPVFAESEAPIRRMVEEQARGGNPYLSRAKEVFDRIKLDLKPERKDTVGYVFASIETLKSAGEPVDADSLVRQYKNLTGSRIRGVSGIGGEFEKATGITIDEVLNNAPVNIELERMKHGYPAKQFNRMKPYLKSAFTSRHPDAPPPMPTWGDLKTWTEHGEGKPEWAGTTRTAVPREVYDAAAKGPDGKPKYPPAWMPIHLMPCWNYIVKKSGDSNPYQTRAASLTQEGQVNIPNRASFQEGIALSSLRKYVQFRGGASGLVDIPSNKLEDVGLSHAEIFKSDKDLMKDIETLIKVKIIDPVELLKIIKEEMKVKKSISLVIDGNEKPFVKSLFTERQLKKSLINEIKRLKSGKSFVSKL